jgi:hypothetical protein
MDGVSSTTPAGCLGCPTGSFCCKNSGACSASGQTEDVFCRYSGNYPNGCWENGVCRSQDVCKKIMPPPGPHKITFTNNNGAEIWVGAYSPYASQGDYKPVGAWDPMWKLMDGESKAVTVPFSWRSGRFWARRECAYSGGTTLKCANGNCKDQLHCAVSGDNPATLAEFTMMGGDGNGVDNYDVSMVDGFNVLVKITPKPRTSTPNPAGFFCMEVGCKNTPACWTEGKWPDAANPKGCLSPCHVAKYQDTRHCCKCDMTTDCSCESGTPPAGNCCVHADSYGCSPFHIPGQPHPTDTICDYNGKHGRPGAAWAAEAQKYVDDVIAACPGVYGWQFHDMDSLFTCVDPEAPVDYEISFERLEI